MCRDNLMKISGTEFAQRCELRPRQDAQSAGLVHLGHKLLVGNRTNYGASHRRKPGLPDDTRRSQIFRGVGDPQWPHVPPKNANNKKGPANFRKTINSRMRQGLRPTSRLSLLHREGDGFSAGRCTPRPISFVVKEKTDDQQVKTRCVCLHRCNRP
jgi:hypothetical protein